MELTKRQLTIRSNKLDNIINEAVKRRCSGIPINIMDIGKVFKAGKIAAGDDSLKLPEVVARIEDATVAAYKALAVTL